MMMKNDFYVYNVKKKFFTTKLPEQNQIKLPLL